VRCTGRSGVRRHVAAFPVRRSLGEGGCAETSLGTPPTHYRFQLKTPQVAAGVSRLKTKSMGYGANPDIRCRGCRAAKSSIVNRQSQMRKPRSFYSPIFHHAFTLDREPPPGTRPEHHGNSRNTFHVSQSQVFVFFLKKNGHDDGLCH